MCPRTLRPSLRLNSSLRSLGVLVAALLLVLVAVPASANDTPDWTGWLDDTPGLQEAIRLHEETGKPMFIYFYATWCGYCQQFERVLLTEKVVDDYMDSIIAVRINGELSRSELELRQIYRVSGFPALFMHSERTKTLSPVSRMEVADNGKPRLKSGEDFVRELKNAASR